MLQEMRGVKRKIVPMLVVVRFLIRHHVANDLHLRTCSQEIGCLRHGKLHSDSVVGIPWCLHPVSKPSATQVSIKWLCGTYGKGLSGHDTILVGVIWHTRMPGAEVSEHDVAFVHDRSDWRPDRSTGFYCLWSNRTGRGAESLRLLDCLVHVDRLLGRDCLAGLVRVGVRAEPELGSAIVEGKVYEGGVGDD